MLIHNKEHQSWERVLPFNAELGMSERWRKKSPANAVRTRRVCDETITGNSR